MRPRTEERIGKTWAAVYATIVGLAILGFLVGAAVELFARF